MANESSEQIGRVVQIIGPVVDVEFSNNYLPPIYQALRISSEGFDVETTVDVVAEVQQHLGEGRVRAVSMLPTDGMVRGMKVIDLGGPISVPVGEATLGPAAVSLIGDSFPRRSLGSAMGVYAAGIFFGSGVAYALGAYVIGALDVPGVAMPTRRMLLVGNDCACATVAHSSSITQGKRILMSFV